MDINYWDNITSCHRGNTWREIKQAFALPLGEGFFNWKIFPVVKMTKTELLFAWGVF